MNRSLIIASALLGGMAIAPLIVPPMVQGVELSDGTVYFVSPPRLDPDSVYSTRTAPLALGATYYFTLEIPDDAGEPLSQVSIAQYGGNSVIQDVQFLSDESFAFGGTRRDREEELTLGGSSFDDESRTLLLTFDPPVEPGTTLTIGIRPRNNPRSEGVYLFGVTAYPPGDQIHGQFLGYARLQFSNPDYFWFH